MIKKITHIKSVSRFKNYSSDNDEVSFARTTLIYALNGRGKTSLSSIIQSFIKNDAGLINIHKSRVYSGEPEVSLKFDTDQTAAFKDGSWNKSYDDMSVLTYDRSFIYQNIHTEAFEHGHKKNLYKLLAIGDDASKARDEVAAKKKIKEDSARALATHTSSYSLLGLSTAVSVDKFVKQEGLSGVELAKMCDDLEEATKKINALTAIDKVKQKPQLSDIAVNMLRLEPLKETCESVITSGSKDEMDLIRAHIESMHADSNENKQLLALGVKAMGNNRSRCALCGQDIATDNAKDLVNAMFNIFNAKYTNLQKKISEALDLLGRVDTNAIMETVKSRHAANKDIRNVWVESINAIGEVGTVEDIETKIDFYKRAIEELSKKLKEKRSHPSNAADDEYNNAISAHADLGTAITQYNETIKLINEKITSYKNGLDTKDLPVLKQKVANIDDIMRRNSEAGKKYVADYITLSANAKASDTAHKKALSDYETAQKAVLDEHANEMNGFLSYCGAKFSIGKMEQGRGNSQEPFVDYSIKIVGGDADDEVDARSATETILSDGERNLLALAFFWSLYKKSDMTKTIMILDDPIGGVDESWQKTIVDKINELLTGNTCQVIMMTHSKEFAQLIANGVSNVKQLTVENRGERNGCIIAPYDVDADMKYQQFKDIDRLMTYIEDPTTSLPTDIQRSIRNILENAIKHKYYQKLVPLISEKKWLRDFIECPEIKSILEDNGSYADLSVLCSKSAPAHHDSPAATAFNQADAETYAKKTLDVIERI